MWSDNCFIFFLFKVTHFKLSLVNILDQQKPYGRSCFEDAHATKNYNEYPGITCDLQTLD